MKDLYSKNKKMFVVIFLFLIGFSIFAIQSSYNDSDYGTLKVDQLDAEIENQKEINNNNIIENEMQREPQMPVIYYVDIKGAVANPNVYKLEDGSRVQDAIKMAGGFLNDADKVKINLAARIKDEMVIYVPKVGEVGQQMTGNFIGTEETEGKININTATIEELEELPGIGASKAESIKAYREKNGFFKKIEELTNVSGIGTKSFEKLENLVIVR